MTAVISPEALALVGLIMVQWSHLQSQIEFEIMWMAGPDDKIRHEAKHQLGFLRDAAPRYLADARPGALEHYQRNLSQIFRFKGIRDALAHGSMSLKDNEGFPGVVVAYKQHKLKLTMARLAEVADGISLCAGFFFGFRDWLSAATHLQMLEALLQTQIERERQQTSGCSTHTLQPPPQSSQG